MKETSLPQLESISLCFQDAPLLGGPSLKALLSTSELSSHEGRSLQKDPELLAPQLWNLPEIFRKKVLAYSGHYLNEIVMQNRMTEMIIYNFDNGWRINSKEILRHPWHRSVPRDLLPLPKSPQPNFEAWPLTSQKNSDFISQNSKEIEEILQHLLARIILWHRQKKLQLYLESAYSKNQLRLQGVSFQPEEDLSWDVEFIDRPSFLSNFRLISKTAKKFYYFESFAFCVESAELIVAPWQLEFNQLQENIADTGSLEQISFQQELPRFQLTHQEHVRDILSYLRQRKLPVEIENSSQKVPGDRSTLQTHLTETGKFTIQHRISLENGHSIELHGWSKTTQYYLLALQEGVTAALGMEPKDLAARSLQKREWDLKLLKHVGILQYLVFEALNLHYTGITSDGTSCPAKNLFPYLETRIQSLLVSGTSNPIDRNESIVDLCSRSVLACLDEFLVQLFHQLKTPEPSYCQEGELFIEGLVEREFRILHLILQQSAIVTNGEIFRKSRTSLLTKLKTENHLWHFPGDPSGNPLGLRGTLEVLQPTISSGVQLYYHDQPLQELEEDDFHVDFIVQTDSAPQMMNWFELNPRFFLYGEEVDSDHFLSLGGGGVIEYQKKLYLVPTQKIPSLKRLESFWLKLQNGKNSTLRKKGMSKIYQLPRHQTLELLALRASGISIRGDEQWKDLCAFYDQLGSQDRQLTLPPSVHADLKPYQTLGVQWLLDLYRLRLGALLADDMGLGKTLQTLCFLEILRKKEDLGPVLVVVPSSLVFNWKTEMIKFTPELPSAIFAGKDRDKIGREIGLGRPLVLLTTYSLLMEHQDFFQQYKWNIVVFDEAQNLKNISAKRTSASRSISAKFKICLTGTPMENHYGEFFSLVDLLVPGSLGNLTDFRQQFVNTSIIAKQDMNDLKTKIRPLLLRRTKREILDQLPEKQETKVSIAFEEKQKEIYRDIALSYNRRVQETMATQNEANVQLQMLTALLRLRQACSDPAALPNVQYKKVPPKLEALLESTQEIVESGESALVFTQFLQTLEHAAKILSNAQIPVYVLHGGIPSKQRQKILEQFNNDPKGCVLLMTLKTGGVGLNLTKASYVFHLEPWWNPAVENQATDRAHRLGQAKAVQVFRYIMHESLEEKIELLKERKDRKFNHLFTSTEQDVEVGMGTNHLSKEDFDLLLGV